VSKEVVLYGADNRPMKMNETAEADKVLRSWSSFVTALNGLDKPLASRSRNPFQNHAWVYAAVMAIAINVSQVPIVVYRETPDNPATSRKRRPKAGKNRTAIQRVLSDPRRRIGIQPATDLVPEYDHPISQLLHSPNPFQTQAELIQMTAILMHTRGACFWLKTLSDGSPVSPGEDPEYLWPMNPEQFCPRFDGTTFVGWDVSFNYLDPSGAGSEYYGFIRPYQVCWFRYMNPDDPLGWLSPIAAAANGVSMDMAAMAYNRAVLMNGAKPGGLLMHEDDIDEEEEKKLRKYWEQRHEGPQAANKLAILTGGFKYIDIGLGPKDMDYLEQRKWDRDEVLGAIGVSKSILSITDGLNYSVQQSQDKNFWDKKLMPMMLGWESTIDRSLMYNQTDDQVAAFDFSGVDALRAGLKEKTDIVVQLTGPQIHMPPRDAFDLVGLKVKRYAKDDVSLIPTSLASSIDVAEGKAGPNASNPQDTGQPAAPGDPRQPRPADSNPPDAPANA
jgi:phage portal protein BeeE